MTGAAESELVQQCILVSKGWAFDSGFVGPEKPEMLGAVDSR
jgi:hypothetical protein